MRKFIAVISSATLLSSFAIAQTRLPAGLSIATQTQETTASVTVGDGDMFVNDELTVAGQATFSKGPIVPIVDVAVATPTAAGQIVRTSLNVIYVSSAAVGVSNWLKLGAQ